VTVRPVPLRTVGVGCSEPTLGRQPLPEQASARRPGEGHRPDAAVRGSRRLLGLRLLGGGATAGIVAGVALAMLGPLAFGGRTFAVLSGSMEPTLHVGDLVLEKKIAAPDIHVGDIVTFRSPEDSSKLITHRVRRVVVADGTVKVTTKGDANLSVERWTVPADGTVGRALGRVPKIGYLLVWTRSPAGRMLFIVLPACLLGLSQLRRIWTKPGGGAGDAQA
jgi:signal peptidase